MRAKLAYGAVAIAVAAIAGWLVWRGQRPLEVHVLAPVSGVPVTVAAVGNLDAERVSALGFDETGAVADLPVRIGDQVHASQVLARLDDRRQKLAVAAAQDGLNVAQATLALKQQLAERARGMESRGTGSRAATQDAEVEAAIARASLHRAITMLDLERERLDRLVLKSPYDGVVVGVAGAQGAVLAAGTPVVTVADRSSYRIVAYVDEARAGMIHPGQPATIVLRSRQGDPIEGKVDRIFPQSDKVAEEREIGIAIDPAASGLYLAEQADVELRVGAIDHGVLAPERIIRDHRDANARVWGVAHGRLVDIPVKLGRRLGDGRIEIVSPLPADTQVVADRLLDVKAGDAAIVATTAAQDTHP